MPGPFGFSWSSKITAIFTRLALRLLRSLQAWHFQPIPASAHLPTSLIRWNYERIWVPTHHKTTEAPRQPDFRQKFSATIDQNRHRISMDLLLHALRLFDGMLFKMPNPNLGKLWLLWCKADGLQITYRYNALHAHYDDKWGTILYKSCTNNQCQDETCIMNEMTFPISTSWLQLCDTILTRGEFFVRFYNSKIAFGSEQNILKMNRCLHNFQVSHVLDEFSN